MEASKSSVAVTSDRWRNFPQAAQLDMLFRRAVFAWLIADGDMRLKNLALLKIAERDAKAFTSVRAATIQGQVLALTSERCSALVGDAD